MDIPLSRRRLLHVSALTTIPVSGCLGIGGPPETIPFTLRNETDQTRTISVEFIERETNDVLLSKTADLDTDSRHEFEAGPIKDTTRYMIQYEVDDQTGQYPVSSGGLRGIQVVVEEDGEVQVIQTTT